MEEKTNDGSIANANTIRTEDSRIVYGAHCSWWDSINKVAITSSGVPCCPNCKSVLMEAANLQEWMESVRAFDKRIEADGAYTEFVLWIRGQCYPNTVEAYRSWVDAGGRLINMPSASAERQAILESINNADYDGVGKTAPVVVSSAVSIEHVVGGLNIQNKETEITLLWKDFGKLVDLYNQVRTLSY